MSKKTNVLEFFFLGRNFGEESKSMMGIIYTSDKRRSDWGQVETLLAEGNSVCIRPPTDEEFLWAHKKLEEWKNFYSNNKNA